MKQEIKIVYEILNRTELTEADLALEQAALSAAQRAYAPYSRFRVGAALRLTNGAIVTGSNQENAAYPSGTCAERTALFYAGAQYPDVAPEALLIVALNEGGRVPMITPCGACRQVILEACLRHAPFKIILTGEQQVIVIDDCRALLPLSFDGSDL